MGGGHVEVPVIVRPHRGLVDGSGGDPLQSVLERGDDARLVVGIDHDAEIGAALVNVRDAADRRRHHVPPGLQQFEQR